MECSEHVCCLTNGDLEFQYKELEKIINKPKLQNVPIVVCSIVGPTRSGKSYLLNVFRMLLTDPESENFEKAFKTSSKPESETCGIWMTREPIFVQTSDKQVAVFLMDTQGSEGGDRLQFKEADIFTISSTLSYIQILNGLTQFAKHFQFDEQFPVCLQVLVRDWDYPKIHKYGLEGGKLYRQTLLDQSDLEKHFQCMEGFFKSTDIFLMPEPNRQITKSESTMKCDVGDETWDKIQELYRHIFCGDILLQACNDLPTGKTFLDLAKNLLEFLHTADLPPPPEGSFKSYVVIVMDRNVDKYFDYYKKKMPKNSDLDGKQLSLKHEEIKTEASDLLRLKCSTSDVSSYVKRLHQKIIEEFQVILKATLERHLPKCFDHYTTRMINFLDFFGEELDLKHEQSKREATDELYLYAPADECIKFDMQPYKERLQNNIEDKFEIFFCEVMEKKLEECLQFYCQKTGNSMCPDGDTLHKLHQEVKDQAIQSMSQNNKHDISLYLSQFQNQVDKKFQIFLERILERKLPECIAHYKSLMNKNCSLYGEQLDDVHKRIKNGEVKILLHKNESYQITKFVNLLENVVDDLFQGYLTQGVEKKGNECFEFYKEQLQRQVKGKTSVEFNDHLDVKNQAKRKMYENNQKHDIGDDVEKLSTKIDQWNSELQNILKNVSNEVKKWLKDSKKIWFKLAVSCQEKKKEFKRDLEEKQKDRVMRATATEKFNQRIEFLYAKEYQRRMTAALYIAIGVPAGIIILWFL